MSSENIRHSSKTVEHFTPPNVVESARALLGTIDLDPASCEKAQEFVRAGRWIGEEEDGLQQEWFGRVFLNPPGGKKNGKSQQKVWWQKLADEYQRGRVEAALFVCFSLEFLQVSQVKTPTGQSVPLHYPICFPSRRLAYVKADGNVGESPPHASCLVYLPPRPYLEVKAGASLVQHFGWLGFCR